MNHEDQLRLANQHARKARELVDWYAGRSMPNEVAAKIEEHLSTAEALREKVIEAEGEAYLHEPQYKRPMHPEYDATKGVGVDDRSGGSPFQGNRLEVPIPADKSFRDHLGLGRVDEDAICGWLGQHVKAQVVPTSPDEMAKWNRYLGQKDMGTTTGGAGGYLVPTVVASYMIDLMRANVVCQAAGARVVPMTNKVVQVPRLAGDVGAAWLAEAAAVTPSDATLEQVTLTANRMEVGPVKISHELSEDSDPVGIGQVVARSIAASAALKMDAAALRGSGTPPEPKGVRNQTGVTLYAPGANGDIASYDIALALLRSVASANAVPNALITTPGSAVTLAGLKEATTNAYLAPPPMLSNLRHLTTTSIPSNLTKGTGSALTEWYCGDFRQLLLGIRTNLSLQTLTELYRANGQIGFIARMRGDVAVEHGNAFAVATFVDD